MDNKGWILSQIESYQKRIGLMSPAEACEELERIDRCLEHIRLPDYQKRELYKLLGGVK